jgi:hypothetical protein
MNIPEWCCCIMFVCLAIMMISVTVVIWKNEILKK